MTPLISCPAEVFAGDVAVPGDKSISHRALILAASCIGESRIQGLLEADDVKRTAAAVAALGALVERDGAGDWRVVGRGVGGLGEPAGLLDLGNSGTAARLLMGVVASHPFTSFFAGDASLSARPMERVMAPLRRFGAEFVCRTGGRLPLAVRGTAEPMPIDYAPPEPSAQVKSAILLAGLNTPGRTRVVERLPTRDHTERLLRHFGADVTVEATVDGGRAVTIEGQPELMAAEIVVPGDISSAAFPIVAALLVPGSSLTVRGVGINPLRRGLLDTLIEMGAEISFDNRRQEAGEDIADILVAASRLTAVDVPAARAPSMIDEYPVLAAAAACAEGTTRLHGLGELRVKESDRLAAIVDGLSACGVKVEVDGDSVAIDGTGGTVPGGATIAVDFDHRMAMSFLVLGAAAREPVRVDDGEAIETSFPGFATLMNGLGARIEEGS